MKLIKEITDFLMIPFRIVSFMYDDIKTNGLNDSECYICKEQANWKCVNCKEWVCAKHTRGLFEERLCDKCYKEIK